MTRILVVDDHEMVRDAMAGLISSIPQHEVVGVASSIRTAVPVLEQTKPDVVLADLSLDDGSGTELIRVVRQAKLKSRVLIMTGTRDRFAAADAMKAGAAGYVLKTRPTAELIEAIATVMKGERYVSPTVSWKLPESDQDEKASGFGDLSRRESEIFRMVVDGWSTKEIAGRLCISIKTVETHRSNINRKLSVRRTTDLIRLAVAHGISVAPMPAENGDGVIGSPSSRSNS
ncbi:MAG: two-component system, NarL family, nitrate/nitrite response regulator NarL [Chloroflexota bacterium]|jgi:DNA-binding NarL/FixJ family response regulator|nr:two-component system, NarL family, nitrate/nitrite response regulator NarL [Chloroflexota bacterium]